MLQMDRLIQWLISSYAIIRYEIYSPKSFSRVLFRRSCSSLYSSITVFSIRDSGNLNYIVIFQYVLISISLLFEGLKSFIFDANSSLHNRGVKGLSQVLLVEEDLNKDLGDQAEL